MNRLSATRMTVAVAGLTASSIGMAYAQQAPNPVQLPEVNVNASAEPVGYATQPQYNTQTASMGPLGNKSILDTPASVTVLPEDLLVNNQVSTVNSALGYLPSVQIRDQQGYEVSRPQSRGFQGGIMQNTRLDGLNIIGTTAIPTENLSAIEVLNGLAGSLYGPETPAGVFNYILKRPTDVPLRRFSLGVDSYGTVTEQADVGGRTGPDGKIGYRFNVVHGEGGSYAPGSSVDRTLVSADLDFHVDDQTVIETDLSHYSTDIIGLPGSFVYNTGKSTLLPAAVDPTKLGYGQPGAGSALTTDTGLMKIKHDFNDQWHIEFGGLYQNAVRDLFGITNTLTNNSGNYTVTKNFTAVPHFTIGSNEAALNGEFDVFGMKNELSIGTNGFVNGQYSYRNSIAQLLGSASLADPLVLPTKPMPNNGGEYESAALTQQSIITGDTIHFSPQWAIQGVLSTSFISAKSFNTAGKVTSSDSRSGVLSPTVSLIYTPTPKLTAYATYASTEEEGEQAPAGSANVNQFLAPYRDTEYEAGIKYAVSNSLLLTLDAFQMTRPLADTSATTDVFAVIGTQRNTGVELFAQGSITPELSILGGLTYIDARLLGTGNAATNDKLVVGVPGVKGDVTLDYHPAFIPGFALTGAVHFESERAATNTNNTFAPAYATLDLGVRYSMILKGHPTTARLQAINVTGTNYYVSIADGNIVGMAGADTAYLGTPRTIVGSLEVDF